MPSRLGFSGMVLTDTQGSGRPGHGSYSIVVARRNDDFLTLTFRFDVTTLTVYGRLPAGEMTSTPSLGSRNVQPRSQSRAPSPRHRPDAGRTGRCPHRRGHRDAVHGSRGRGGRPSGPPPGGGPPRGGGGFGPGGGRPPPLQTPRRRPPRARPSRRNRH